MTLLVSLQTECDLIKVYQQKFLCLVGSCSHVVDLHLVWWCSVYTIAKVLSAYYPFPGCDDSAQ